MQADLFKMKSNIIIAYIILACTIIVALMGVKRKTVDNWGLGHCIGYEVDSDGDVELLYCKICREVYGSPSDAVAGKVKAFHIISEEPYLRKLINGFRAHK